MPPGSRRQALGDPELLPRRVQPRPGAVRACSTGQSRLGWPSVGAWVTYGLGCESDNLPAARGDDRPRRKGEGWHPLWGNGFLPPVYQGATLQSQGAPILYVERQDGVSELRPAADARFRPAAQRTAPREYRPAAAGRTRGSHRRLRAGVQDANVPRRMPWTSAARPTRRTSYTDWTTPLTRRLRNPLPHRPAAGRAGRAVRATHLRQRRLEGLGPPRRLARRHAASDEEGGQADRRSTARPSRPRGLLESTLVVWSGSSDGRRPRKPRPSRDHNPNGFTMWMAGGGVKAER